MSTYYKNYFIMGGSFDDTTCIEITLPPNRDGIRLLLHVIQTVITEDGGKILNNPALGMDGSVRLTPIIFQSKDAEAHCLKNLQKIFKNVDPIEDDKTKLTFTEFQSIIKKIEPAAKFIEDNGGWFNGETGVSPGFYTIEESYHDNSLSENEKEAFIALVNFMGPYTADN